MRHLISNIRIIRYAVFSRVRAILRRSACAVLPRRRWSYSAGSQVGNWAGGIEVPVFGTVVFVDKDGVKTFRW